MTYVCPCCSYPSMRSDDTCDNPACLANPTLTAEHKAKLVASEEQRQREIAESNARIRAFRYFSA